MKQNWNQVEFYYNAHSNFQKQKDERNLAFLSHIKASDLTAFFEDIENGVDVNFVSDISETPYQLQWIIIIWNCLNYY